MKPTRRYAKPPPPLSNLRAPQIQSYEQFLQPDVPPEQREGGLSEIFRTVFPIKNKDSSLEYVSYTLEKPIYNEEDCIRKSMSYCSPIKVVIRLIVWEEYDGSLSIRDIKEQEVYYGEIPLQTERGTFIIGGIERFCPAKIEQRFGTYFVKQEGFFEAHIVGRGATVKLRYLGSGHYQCWVELHEGILAWMVLQASAIQETRTLFLSEDKFLISFDHRAKGKTARDDITTLQGELIVKKGEKITASHIKKLLSSGQQGLPIDPREFKSLYAAEDVFSEDQTRLVLSKADSVFHAKKSLAKNGVRSLQVTSPHYTSEEAPSPVDFYGAENVNEWVHRTMRPEFIFEQKDLSVLSLCQQLSEVASEDLPLTDLRDPNNSRYQGPGEQVAQVYWRGLLRMERQMIERMNLTQEVDCLMPHDLINAKSLSQEMFSFFEALPAIEQSAIASLCQLRAVTLPTPSPSHPGLIEGEEPCLSIYTSIDANGGLQHPSDTLAIDLISALTPGIEGARPSKALQEALPLVASDEPWVKSGVEEAVGHIGAGQNVWVVFEERRGAVASARLLKDNRLAWLQKKSIEHQVIETKGGPEELTPEPPDVDSVYRRHLDEAGIAKEGATVSPGDVLIGKRSPKLVEGQKKSEKHPLYYPGQYQDTSLYAPTDGHWRVKQVEVCTRKGLELNKRAEEEKKRETEEIQQKSLEQIIKVREEIKKELIERFVGKVLGAKLVDDTGKVLCKNGDTLTKELLEGLHMRYIADLRLRDDEKTQEHLELRLRELEDYSYLIETEAKERIFRLQRGDYLPPGVRIFLKIFLERVSPLQKGDYLLCRYGEPIEVNEQREDTMMPTLSNGEIADLILPKSLAAIQEARLGLAAHLLGESLAIPSGCSQEEREEFYREVKPRENDEGLLYLMRCLPQSKSQ